MSKSVVVELKYPIEWSSGEGKELVKKIELRRPKGKHVKNLGQNISLSDLFKIASKVSDFSPAFFDELDAVDCFKVTEVIGDFLETTEPISKTE